MTKSRFFMRCIAFATASTYNLRDLANALKRQHHTVAFSRDVVHVKDTQKMTDVFFFAHGALICWGLNKREELKWVDYVKEFAIDPLAQIETDHFGYRLGEDISIDTHERFKIDVITLDSDYSSQVKLAISYGLAQSVKLEAFEDVVQQTVLKNAFLPGEISKRGLIPLSRRSIFSRMGEIFLVRSSINLNSEYLDTPEFFWRNPNLESFYVMTKKFLDIPSRVMALNQKLDVLQELLDILNSQLQHRHSSMLEMIIIILILLEIIISLLHWGW